MNIPRPLQKVINSFSRLPGIGPKSAEKLAFYLLKEKNEYLEEFSNALINLKNDLRFCSICFNIDESSPCSVCIDQKRNEKLLCVVESPLDLIAFEKSKSFYGFYHILHGVLSPIDGIGPSDLKIKELLTRITEKPPTEIILALNPSLEGEATSSYIKKQIESLNLNIQISRIARGLPTGSNIEYADDLTLRNALEGRQSL